MRRHADWSLAAIIVFLDGFLDRFRKPKIDLRYKPTPEFDAYIVEHGPEDVSEDVRKLEAATLSETKPRRTSERAGRR